MCVCVCVCVYIYTQAQDVTQGHFYAGLNSEFFLSWTGYHTKLEEISLP